MGVEVQRVQMSLKENKVAAELFLQEERRLPSVCMCGSEGPFVASINQSVDLNLSENIREALIGSWFLLLLSDDLETNAADLTPLTSNASNAPAPCFSPPFFSAPPAGVSEASSQS